MGLWFYIYQMWRFGQNMIVSFDIIFWKIVLQNKPASKWFFQPRSSTKKIMKSAVGDQKKNVEQNCKTQGHERLGSKP